MQRPSAITREIKPVSPALGIRGNTTHMHFLLYHLDHRSHPSSVFGCHVLPTPMCKSQMWVLVRVGHQQRWAEVGCACIPCSCCSQLDKAVQVVYIV